MREQRASLSPKLGYVGTDLGVLPADWKVVSIADAGEVVGGRQRSPHAQGTPTKYLRVANVFDGHIDTSDVLEMPFTSAEKARFRLRVGDILLNEGQSLELVGRSAMFRGSPEDCCFQNTLVRFRVGGQNVPQYLQSVFQRYLHTGVFSTIALQTTSIAHLGTTRFAALLVPLPPTEEQKAIAGALGDTDALIESLEQLLAKKRQIKQGAMQELLTGQRRLPGFSVPWSEGRVGTVVTDLVAGVSVNSDTQGSESSVPAVLKTSALGRGNFYPEESKPIIRADRARARTSPRRDSILVSRMNTPDLVGDVAYVSADYPSLFLPDRIWMTQVASDSDVNMRWLAYVLASREYRRRIGDAATGTSGSMKNLSKGALLGLPVRFPSAEEQTAIATTLSDMDAELSALEARVAKTRQIKQGMMQTLLTGRIRLVPPQEEQG